MMSTKTQPLIQNTVDQIITAWIAAKFGVSKSDYTKRQYHYTIRQFREYVQELTGCDLDGDTHILATTAEIWAARSTTTIRISPATMALRLSIICSFYDYAVLHGFVQENPILLIQRPSRAQTAPEFLEKQIVTQALLSIDQTTLDGKRDFALLCIALFAGKNVAELAQLRMKHVAIKGPETVCIKWVARTKTATTRTDVFQGKLAKIFLTYLEDYYIREGKIVNSLRQLSSESPVWVSLSNRNEGQAVSRKTIQNILEKYFGTTRMHGVKHASADALFRQGMSIQEIARQLKSVTNQTTVNEVVEKICA